MEWRIRESSHGGFFAECGATIKPGVKAGYKPGYFLPAFIVYESVRFDTEKDAEKYIQSKMK